MRACEEKLEQIALYMTGDLEAAERERLETHLAGCAACVDYLNALREDDAQLAAFAADVEVHAAAVERGVLARIAAGETAVLSRLTWRRAGRWAVAALILIGVALAVLAVLNEQRQSENPVIADNTTRPAGYEVPQGRSTEAQPIGTPDMPRADDAMAPLPIELPVAMYRGTPINVAGVDNLERPRGKDRPPFYAPKGATNVAKGKPVIASDDLPILGEIPQVTDGDKEAAEGSFVEFGPFLQHVTIDLQARHEIYAILLWHYHKEARVYFDVIVQVSDRPDFKNAVTLFNNDMDNSAGLGEGKDLHYVETNEGRLVDARGVRGRYVRLYSNGSNASDLNHYIEVEVFGWPVGQGTETPETAR